MRMRNKGTPTVVLLGHTESDSLVYRAEYGKLNFIITLTDFDAALLVSGGAVRSGGAVLSPLLIIISNREFLNLLPRQTTLDRILKLQTQ